MKTVRINLDVLVASYGLDPAATLATIEITEDASYDGMGFLVLEEGR